MIEKLIIGSYLLFSLVVTGMLFLDLFLAEIKFSIKTRKLIK